jgi:hypothetical protein
MTLYAVRWSCADCTISATTLSLSLRSSRRLIHSQSSSLVELFSVLVLGSLIRRNRLLTRRMSTEDDTRIIIE